MPPSSAQVSTDAPFNANGFSADLQVGYMVKATCVRAWPLSVDTELFKNMVRVMTRFQPI